MSTTAHQDWYRFCRPYLEELNPRVDLDPVRYVAGLVERAQAFHADTVVFIGDEGGHPNYPSRLAPMSDHLHGADLLGLVAERAHRDGLRFGVGFLGMHCNSYVCGEHSEWLQRGRAGELAPFYTSYLVCPNSPYRQYYTEYVREVVTRYTVDSIYLEGVYIRHGYCYCDHCRAQFEQLFGRPLVEESVDSADFRHFRQDSVTWFHERIRRVVEKASSETIVVGCTYPIWMGTTDVTTFREQVDVVARENQWGHGPDILPHEAGLRMLMLKAEARKPILGTWWAARNVDLDYAPRSPAHARTTFMQTLSYGAIVQPHIQTLFEVDQSLMPVLAELFGCVERVRPYLLDARLLPFAAILDWAGSADVDHYFGDALKGAYLSLQEDHLPLNVISPEDVVDGRLADYRVLVLPDALRLSRAVVAEITRYVRDGGGLVATYRSGWYDERGLRRTQNPLLALAGVRFAGVGGSIDPKTYPIYYRVVAEDDIWADLVGRLLSFRGGYAVVRPEEGAHVLAHIEDMDYSRMHKAHMIGGAYPGGRIGPMMVAQGFGTGRVVYIAGSLAASARLVGDREALAVLARATRWAARETPPLATTLPPSVEVVAHASPGRLAVFLVNRTANQIGPDSAIRYVVPIEGAVVQARVGKPPSAVRSLTGGTIHTSHEGEWLHIELERLAEYEVLLIEL